LLVR